VERGVKKRGRGGWSARGGSLALACVLAASSGVGAQAITSPQLLPGQSYTFARPATAAPDVTGQVLLEVELNASGEVRAARPLEARLSAAVDEGPILAAALTHVRTMRFSPAQRDRHPVPARTRVRVTLQPPAAGAGPVSAVAHGRRAVSRGGVAFGGVSVAEGAASVSPALLAQVSEAPSAGPVTDPPPVARGDGAQSGAAAQVAPLLEGSEDGAAVEDGARETARSLPAGDAGEAASALPVANAQLAAPPVAADARDSQGVAGPTPVGEVDGTRGAASGRQGAGRVVPPPMAADHAAPASDYGARAHLKGGTGSAAPVAASDLDLELGVLRAVPRSDAQSFLSLSPGVVLGNHSGIGHTSSIFLRGFDAGEGQDVEVRVDGIPINEPSNAHAHGYADTQFLIPETVQRLRVQQGVFDPAQSDFAVAGSARYALGVRERGLSAQLGYGRFGEQRGLVLWAPSDATSGTFAALDLRRGDGFGPNRAHKSGSTLLRYARAAGPLHYAVLAGAHAQQFDSAGVVRETDVEARRLPCGRSADSQFFCTPDPQQGGSGQRYLLSGKLSWARPGRSYELQVYGMSRQLRMRENFTGSLLSVAGDGLDEHYAVATLGAMSRYTLTPSLRGERQRIELGIEARHDRGETRSFRIRSQSSVPYETLFDRGLTLMHLSGYARSELNLLRRVSLRFGARVDAFGYHTENRAAPSEDRVGPRLPFDARDAWGTALSPRGSLVLHAWPGLDWTISAGQGVRSSDAEALSEGERAPFARVLALETGPTWTRRTPAALLEARAFAFATRVAEDMLFDAARGRNVPVGPSNRYGVSLSARARIGEHHDTMLSAAWADARAIARGAGIFELGRGEALPYVPRAVLRLDHASRFGVRVAGQPLQLTAAVGGGWVGPRPLPLGARGEPSWQVDLAARARYRFVELGVSLENLFDVRNRSVELNYASSFGLSGQGGAPSLRPARHFAAGAPRTWWLTLTVYLDDLETG